MASSSNSAYRSKDITTSGLLRSRRRNNTSTGSSQLRICLNPSCRTFTSPVCTPSVSMAMRMSPAKAPPAAPDNGTRCADTPGTWLRRSTIFLSPRLPLSRCGLLINRNPEGVSIGIILDGDFFRLVHEHNFVI